MENEVEILCDQISLTDLEQEEIHIESSDLEEVITKRISCLFAKLPTSCPYNREAFKATMKNFWWPLKLTKFHKLGEGLMMIESENKIDKEQVLRDSPWSFDNCLILLKKYDGKQQVKTSSIKEASFWVRIHDLPLMARNKIIGEIVGKSVGNVDEVDLEVGEVEWGE